MCSFCARHVSPGWNKYWCRYMKRCEMTHQFCVVAVALIQVESENLLVGWKIGSEVYWESVSYVRAGSAVLSTTVSAGGVGAAQLETLETRLALRSHQVTRINHFRFLFSRYVVLYVRVAGAIGQVISKSNEPAARGRFEIPWIIAQYEV